MPYSHGAVYLAITDGNAGVTVTNCIWPRDARYHGYRWHFTHTYPPGCPNLNVSKLASDI